MLLYSQDVKPHASFTVNIADLLKLLKSQGNFNGGFGGMFIKTVKPTGKLLVKQHAISRKRLLMAPYYGTVDYLQTHAFVNIPVIPLKEGTNHTVSVHTCFSQSGCYMDQFHATSTNTSVVTVFNPPVWPPPPKPVYAVAKGNAYLESYATGYMWDTEMGYYGELWAHPLYLEVTKCGNVLIDPLIDEYVPTYTDITAVCSDFTTNVSTANFTFNELNVSNTAPPTFTVHYIYGIFRNELRTGVECVRTQNGGTALTINSAYRGPRKNLSIPTVRNSNHIQGVAVDFHAPTGSALRDNVYDSDAIKNACGACREPLEATSTWVHFDWRGGTCPSGW